MNKFNQLYIPAFCLPYPSAPSIKQGRTEQNRIELKRNTMMFARVSKTGSSILCHHNQQLQLPAQRWLSTSRLQTLRNQLAMDTSMDPVNHFLNKTTKTKSSFSLDDIYNQLPPIPSQQEQLKQQQLLLTDTHNRHHTYLRLSVSERCNLRCQYCMPPEGVPLSPKSNLLSTDELLHIAQVFVTHGVTKIRLTGGEPMVRPDIVDLVQGLSTKHIGMTTNGLTLVRQLEPLMEAGLSHVNISLDTLHHDRFIEITRRPGLEKVLKAIELAATQTHLKVKINCVVMNGFNDDELMEFVTTFTPMGVDVRFIEWMPFHDNGWNRERFVSYKTMVDTLQQQLPGLRSLVPSDPNDTTKWWSTTREEDSATSATGRVGFITSMSEHFCGSCNRLRITADGQLKVCLFGSSEVSLRDALRRGLSLEPLIHYAIQKKHAVLGGHGTAEGIVKANDNRPMTLIGG